METDRIRLMAPVFSFDNHEVWYEIRDAVGSSETLYGEENRDDPAKSGRNRFDGASHDSGEKSEGETSGPSEEEIRMVKNALKDWKEISEKIETDLETFHKEEGGQMPALVQSLAALHREKYSYSTFLKKFMKNGEKLKISDEDFDTIFYTYGLKLYKNLPLIEPLEYQEMNNIRELVIAIDTSGSCQGEVVQNFLQKTWNIFRQRENFFTHFRIHIIQCDMLIRDVAEITSMAQFDRYIETLEIKGLGGTDFRPVFTYVQEQLDSHVFTKLGGLLYFTDGDGVYPKQKPSFMTAFLFPHDNKDITVPPWAIKYSLEGDE
jgi:predicted metal-dependent peptidase